MSCPHPKQHTKASLCLSPRLSWLSYFLAFEWVLFFLHCIFKFLGSVDLPSSSQWNLSNAVYDASWMRTKSIIQQRVQLDTDVILSLQKSARVKPNLSMVLDEQTVSTKSVLLSTTPLPGKGIWKKAPYPDFWLYIKFLPSSFLPSYSKDKTHHSFHCEMWLIGPDPFLPNLGRVHGSGPRRVIHISTEPNSSESNCILIARNLVQVDHTTHKKQAKL